MGQINLAHALFRLPNPGLGRVLVGREKGGKLQLVSVPKASPYGRRVRGRARRTLALHRRGGR